MPRPSPYPKHPVRVLRTLLGFSSAEAFAKFTGVPAETIRNLEQGRRPVTRRVATQIAIATGVSHLWLQAGNVARGRPIGVMAEYLTKENFEAFAGISPRIFDDPNTEDQISNLTFLIQALMRAAAKKRRVPQCSYFLTLAIRDAKKEFDLEKEMVEAMREIDPHHHLIPPSPAQIAKLQKSIQSLLQPRRRKA